MSFSKVAVVTGSNKGIGFHIVKRLCKEFDGDVFLTARNVDNGRKAIDELNQLGLKPKFHQLDIEDTKSIQTFADYIKANYGGLDILVNNAAVFPHVSDDMPIDKVAKETMSINYFGTLNISNSLFPLLRSNARVVNVSSLMGLLSRCKSEDLRKRVSSDSNTIDDITQIVNDYIKACEDGTWKSLGYPDTAYEMSKVALCAVTILQQKEIDQDKSRSNIKISSVTPGYCQTDMTGNKGYKSAEEGADTPVYLTQIGNDIPGGLFWSDRKQVDWFHDVMGL